MVIVLPEMMEAALATAILAALLFDLKVMQGKKTALSVFFLYRKQNNSLLTWIQTKANRRKTRSAWARALPGREAAERNEVLRAFYAATHTLDPAMVAALFGRDARTHQGGKAR